MFLRIQVTSDNQYFMFTPRNGNARELLKQGKFLKDIKRKLCANKGYIGKALFENCR